MRIILVLVLGLVGCGTQTSQVQSEAPRPVQPEVQESRLAPGTAARIHTAQHAGYQVVRPTVEAIKNLRVSLTDIDGDDGFIEFPGALVGDQRPHRFEISTATRTWQFTSAANPKTLIDVTMRPRPGGGVIVDIEYGFSELDPATRPPTCIEPVVISPLGRVKMESFCAKPVNRMESLNACRQSNLSERLKCIQPLWQDFAVEYKSR